MTDLDDLAWWNVSPAKEILGMLKGESPLPDYISPTERKLRKDLLALRERLQKTRKGRVKRADPHRLLCAIIDNLYNLMIPGDILFNAALRSQGKQDHERRESYRHTFHSFDSVVLLISQEEAIAQLTAGKTRLEVPGLNWDQAIQYTARTIACGPELAEHARNNLQAINKLLYMAAQTSAPGKRRKWKGTVSPDAFDQWVEKYGDKVPYTDARQYLAEQGLKKGTISDHLQNIIKGTGKGRYVEVPALKQALEDRGLFAPPSAVRNGSVNLPNKKG